MIPPSTSCATSVAGICSGAAAPTMRSYGACSGQPVVSVAHPHVHVAVAERVEDLARACGQRLDDLERIHGRDDLGEQRGLISRAGPDLEDAMCSAPASSAASEKPTM